MKKLLLLSLLICHSWQSYAQEQKLKPIDIDAIYEKNGEIVIETENGIRKIKVDDALRNTGTYNIKITEREFFAADQKIIRRALTIEERTQLHKLVYEANSKYNDRDLEATWKLIERAMKIDPWNTKLINMKGSVLFLMGAPELAVIHWKQSLKIDSNQPEVTALVTAEEKKLEEHTRSKEPEVESKGTISKDVPSKEKEGNQS